MASHRRFIAKYDLSVTLAAYTDSQLCKAFGVLKEKNLYGKKVVGIARSTFLFDATGGLRMAWQGVSAPGHAETVLRAAQSI